MDSIHSLSPSANFHETRLSVPERVDQEKIEVAMSPVQEGNLKRLQEEEQIRKHFEQTRMIGGALDPSKEFTHKMMATFMGAAHSQVKNKEFFIQLQNKTLNPKIYLQYLTNQKAAYEAVENMLLQRENQAVFSQICSQEIFRATAFTEDQAFIAKQFDLDLPDPSPEVKIYIEELEKMVSENPVGLVAVTFLRYSGLFLGRSLESKVRGWLLEKIPLRSDQERQGMAVYHFPDPIDQNRGFFIKLFSESFNSLRLKPEEKEYCVSVTPKFFGLSDAVLEGLFSN